MAFALTSASFAACQLRTISNRVSVKPYIAVSRIGRRKTAVCQAETGAANLADIYEQISELSVDLDAFPVRNVSDSLDGTS